MSVTNLFYSFLTSLIVVGILTNPFIRFLQKQQFHQVIRDDGPESHLKKTGTPTMGGTLLIGITALNAVGWSHSEFRVLGIVLFALLSFAWVGWLDDYLKIVRGNPRGLIARWKFLLQVLFSGVIAFYLTSALGLSELTIPFVSYSVNLGLAAIPFYMLVIVGTSNAVNLTDGLDGLVIVPVMLVLGGLMGLHYLQDGSMTSVYFFIVSLLGAGLAFLWFNAHPARLFMGDVGALSLGAVLAVIAILFAKELVLVIMGIVFVVEALSVMLQVASFKLRGKRIFKMAPIHHHFELSGIPETQVVVRAWIVTLVFVMIGVLGSL